ncbi:MAG: late competence development ComFB family protein [Desulfovibrionaceae bacterium]
MSVAVDEYIFNGVDLRPIKNKNELRVVRLLPQALARYPDFRPDTIDMEDIYALALNKLPPRYVQRVSIILREVVSDEMILEVLDEALHIVMSNPNH